MTSNAFQPGIIATETHNGPLWSALILLAVLGPAISVAFHPTPPARFALVLVAVIGVVTIAMAWGGFQYWFFYDRVDVRMLGFRLRSIPKSDILSYSVEPWPFARGYGIRGIGRTRAYVWCNRVVHIKTANSEIYLGHNDPERIIRDLDQMMSFVSRG